MPPRAFADETATRRNWLTIACWLFAVLTGIGFFAASAGAEPKPEDLPPPPGALEREFEAGVQPPDRLDKTLAGGATVLSQPIEIPFIAEGGHIIIEASIAGGPQRPFLLDTGSSHLLSPEAAQNLNAPVVRTVRVGGFGPKMSTARILKVDSIAIGGITLTQQMVGVVDIPNALLDRGSRPRAAGLIGAALLSHYAVTIDYARRTLTLNSPGFKPRSAKFSLPLGFSVSLDGLGHPSIAAEIDGTGGEFIIDTGASGQILLSERFQEGHQPFANLGTILHFLTVGGIGGHANMRMAFGKQARIGSSVIASPIVAGVDAGNSGLKHSAVGGAGVIGNGALANFIVTLDAGAARAYFEPVERPHATMLYGTGMILDKPDHNAFEVLDVLKGTAAERAGLHPGDRIVAIAGHAARDLGLSDVPGFAPNSRSALAVETADHRRLDLTYDRLLP